MWSIRSVLGWSTSPAHPITTLGRKFFEETFRKPGIKLDFKNPVLGPLSSSEEQAKVRNKAFISYSRLDSELALMVGNELKNSGYEVWIDQIDIHHGQR